MSLLMRPMSEIREQMERLFSDLSHDLGYPLTLRSDWKSAKSDDNGLKTWLPAIEVSESDEEYVIKAEVPGIKPEEIHLEILGNMFLIQGETRQTKEEEKRNVHRSEIRYGRFMRQIPLPSGIQGDNCRAEFSNGILELRVPKMEESRRKRIPVDIKSSK